MRTDTIFEVRINNRPVPYLFSDYYEALDFAEMWGSIVKAVTV